MSSMRGNWNLSPNLLCTNWGNKCYAFRVDTGGWHTNIYDRFYKPELCMTAAPIPQSYDGTLLLIII